MHWFKSVRHGATCGHMRHTRFYIINSIYYIDYGITTVIVHTHMLPNRNSS